MHADTPWIATLAAAGLLAGPPVHGQTRVHLVEDSFAEFADGRLDASGHNIYVARDGTIRTIQRFDLNQDGYVDLLFNSTHDLVNFVPATLATVQPGRRLQHTSLPIDGSIRIVIDDLNRDGFDDALFCPNDSGLQQPKRSLTIMWGGPDGWSPRRRTAWLPTFGAADVVVADLDRDAWPDIVTLNGEAWLPGQPTGRIVRVFPGGPDGFQLTDRSDLGIDGALALAAADIDGDGRREVAVLTRASEIRFIRAGAGPSDPPSVEGPAVTLPGHGIARALLAAEVTGDAAVDLVVATDADAVIVVPGGPGGTWERPRSLPGLPATHLAAGDLDEDGWPDLVLTRLTPTQAAGGEAAGAMATSEALRVLWGAADGHVANRALALEVPAASAAAVGDLDADGHPDLAVAVYQGPDTFAARSRLFFGTGSRRLEVAAGGVETSGATWVAIAPASAASPARAVFANSMGGTLEERVPLSLYWGGPDGFDTAHRTQIPFRSGYESSAADLNADGYTDLIAMNSQHAGDTADDDDTAGANIFWGGPDGLDFTGPRTVLRERKLASSSVADLDHDGYLDLVLGAFESPRPPDLLVIYYGSPDGFSRARRVALPSNGRTTGSLLADFDRDGWLDITIVSSYTNDVHIFRGGPHGFDAERQWRLRVPFPISAEAADLDADGRLDLIVGSYQDPISAHRDTGLSVFWGSDTGFHPWDAQWLPGAAPIGMAVADFDADGYLDLFSPHYLGDLSRESLPSYLYWGGPGGLDAHRRTILVADSAHDALAADFDRDGRLDLAVSSHTRDGTHATASHVFYNDGHRFAAPRRIDLPTVGAHWMWDQDMGHIYHRRWEQTYESSVQRWEDARTTGRLEAKADRPAGTSLRFDVRSGAEAAALSSAPWRPLTGDFSLEPTDRVLQYRATLVSDNGDRYPVLDRVAITLDP